MPSPRTPMPLWVSHPDRRRVDSVARLEPDATVNARRHPAVARRRAALSARARFWQSIRWVAASRWGTGNAQGQPATDCCWSSVADVPRRCDGRTHTRGLPAPACHRRRYRGFGSHRAQSLPVPMGRQTAVVRRTSAYAAGLDAVAALTRYCARSGQRAAESRGRGHVGLPRTPHHGSVRRRARRRMISILPSRDDRVVASGSEVAGGRRGLARCSAPRGGTCSECSS